MYGIATDLLSRRDHSIKLLSCNILEVFCLFSNLFLVNSNLRSNLFFKVLFRDLWSHQMSYV